jgi:hypothetical protein
VGTPWTATWVLNLRLRLVPVGDSGFKIRLNSFERGSWVAMHRLRLSTISDNQRKEMGLYLVKSLVFLFECRARSPRIGTAKQKFQASSAMAERRLVG